MKFKLFNFACFLIVSTVAQAQTVYQWKTGTSGGYTYKYVTNDPTKTRFYTLKNGLTAILSQNSKEPKIVFKMAVRAGSNTDPKTNTGLAHYLEHLLFKGTDKFGTLNYAKEKPLLDKIEALYEVYGKTTDAAKRKEIYKEIDITSGEASKYSIANEYVKMMKSIGSEETNAHTSVEETVYEENLPSNNINRFLAVQAERFRAPVFRLFHTELEAVYEEKNMGLDNDSRKVSEARLKALFPTHNYGQQTTIGTIEDLKKPSLSEIRKYYNKYYVPNNMAIIMSGDINYDELIKKIDMSFAYMVPKALALYNPAPEKPLTQIQKVDVYGPGAENVSVAYRGYAQNSHESLVLDLISSILSNGKAGLLDINLNKQQRVLRSGASYNQLKDYGVFNLSASPKTGQDLEDARKLLLAQVDLIKKGEFDESLIRATVANTKLVELGAYDNNDVRADATMTSFIQNRGGEWNKTLSATDAMAKVTKKEIVDFANRFFADNYVLVLKHKGEDKSIVKVEKPAITAVKTNENDVSPFTRLIIDEKVKPIVPEFLNYTKDLNFGKAGLADVIAVKNTENSIFRMTYRFDKGSYNYKLLPYAAQYLTFLSTDKYSAEQISKEFYNIACTYSINVGRDETTVSVSGLQENFDKAVALVEHVLANCKPNEKMLEDLKGRLLKVRENNKLNKDIIRSGLVSYAIFGADNPFNYSLSSDEIKNIKADDLISLLHNLTNYKHTVTYFGPKDLSSFSTELIKLHTLPKEFIPEAPLKKFVYTTTNTNKVYFADYDMVQAETIWVRNSGLYNPVNAAKINLFNDYFGDGGNMNSVVFQTIREAKALAYATQASYSIPDSREKEITMIAYVGAQADKLNEAVAGMNELLTTLPESDKSFNLSKGNSLNNLETGRITKDGIIYAYLADKKLGFDHDSRRDLYTGLKPLTFNDIKAFHQTNLSSKPYNYCIVASEKRINMGDLEKFGTISKLTLEQIFGY
ncbi:M16 family metallopeptidase [Pedobacter cryoconitis]|uniref:Putative Zn-dependent peptidase n=1 Tax=Pedobacter cryoconitis TaxID=188932 RepID=A0A7X0J5X1_9SPHI|nr:M16 family metallopeptidase [Pedobacter cryoconitis]MBB6500947.1 putative Zn-dependent peptidase [Pedobacter cryoconitis]